MKRLLGVEVVLFFFPPFLFLFFFSPWSSSCLLESHLGTFTAFSVKEKKPKKKHPCCASFLTNSDLVLAEEASCIDSLLLSELYLTCQYNTCLPLTLVQTPSGLVYTRKAMPMKNEEAESGQYWCLRCCLQNTGYSSWKPQSPAQNSVDI